MLDHESVKHGMRLWDFSMKHPFFRTHKFRMRVSLGKLQIWFPVCSICLPGCSLNLEEVHFMSNVHLNSFFQSYSKHSISFQSTFLHFSHRLVLYRFRLIWDRLCLLRSRWKGASLNFLHLQQLHFCFFFKVPAEQENYQFSRLTLNLFFFSKK